MAASTSPKLAKLTRPRLHNVYGRGRLFSLLDECRKRAVVWVVGPPGAGKTALVGSYLEAREIPGAWYHLDADDQDLATFFHYLTRSLDGTGNKKRAPLPALSAEHLGDIPAFTRYYFRAYFSRLTVPAVLVFDNYHDVPSDAGLHAVLAHAALEVPEGISLIIISREDPPAEFARVDALDRMVRIDWPALKLTREEAQSIATLRFDLDETGLRSLYEISQGWAAGLTLALERIKRLDKDVGEFQSEALDSVFNYFAGEILNTVEPEVREFLMRTALVKRLTPELAKQLSGNSNAAGILEHFYRRRLFTDRRGAKPFSYQYHDLFRAFLLDRLEQIYTPIGIGELKQRAATALEQAKSYEEAFHLFSQAGDCASIIRLITQQAQTLLGQGRGSTLRDWIAALPADLRDETPWVNYWLGVALAERSPNEAIEPLEKAYASFAAMQDCAGQLATASVCTLAYSVDMRSFHPLRLWVDRVRVLLAQGTAFPSPSVELQMHVALAFYGYHTLAKDIDTEWHFQRALRMLNSDVAPSDILLGLCVLIECFRDSGRLKEGARVIELCKPLLASDQVSPDNKAYALCCIAWHRSFAGDVSGAWSALLEAEAFRSKHALTAPARYLSLYQGLAGNAIQRGDLALAQSYIDQLESLDDPARILDRGWLLWSKGNIAAARDDWQAAAEFGQREVHLLLEGGGNFFAYFAYLRLAVCQVALGAFGEAGATLEKVRAVLEGTVQFRVLADVDFAAAWLALRSDDHGAFERSVRSAVDLLRRTELHACIWYVDPRVLPAVLSVALERNIESDYVTYMIRHFRCRAPATAGAAWPWPVKIRALGGFEVIANDARLESSRKPAKKPLALLKVLVSAEGDPVSVSQLADWLWPESEADSAQRSLEMALHRARGFLGSADAVLLKDGQISLNRDCVWVDAWDFHDRAKLALSVDEDAVRAAGLYRGKFLPHDLDAAWSVSYRERLHDSFNRLICAQAGEREREGRFAEALTWYRRGLEADDIVESMYQGMMRCQLALGQRADALAAFQRLRRTLSAKLRTLPSAESTALAAQAQTETA